MKSRPWFWIVFGIVLGFIILIGFFLVLGLMAARQGSIAYAAGDIALVHVEGIITSGKSGPAFLGGSGAGSESLLEVLDRVSANPHFRAIVLRVNSPGGTASGAQEIYEKLSEIRRKTGKKIVVSMGDVAASGAYYVSSNADKIYAEPSTLTGSIGVIAELMDFRGLLRKIGVHPETLKSGRLKDIGSETRPMTPEEKKILQRLLDETHQDFIADVARGRKLSVDDVQNLADGRVYTGRQALSLHLIDALGNLDDAEIEAARMAGIAGTFKVVDVDRKSFLEQLVGNSAAAQPFYFGMLRSRLSPWSGILLLPDNFLIH